MAEYIVREKVIAAFDDSRVDRYYGDVDPESVIEVINEIPAADVRPVVLCKDCIHARRYTNKIKCGYWSEQTASEIVCEDDFCSFGEKRKERC